MLRLGLVCWLLLLAAVAHAELPETPRFRRFGFEQGLPKVVTDLAIDRQGYLWIATADGLARYDGVDFKLWQQTIGDSASLLDNAIETVHVDARDRVWVGSAAGLSVLDGRRRGFRHVRLAGHGRGCNQNVTIVNSNPDGALWFGTSQQELCRLDARERVTRYVSDESSVDSLPEGTIWALHPDRQGRLLVGTDTGLARFEGDGFRRIAPETLFGAKITALSSEPDGTIWIGSDKGLHRLGADGRIAPAPWALSPNATHGVVVRDRTGGRWIGTMSGLYREKADVFWLLEGESGGGIWSRESGVLSILQDFEGGIWYATYSQGLVYLPPNWERFATVTTVEGVPLDSVDLRDIAADAEGGFWVASATDLYRLERDSRVLRKVANREALGLQWIHSIHARRDGTLWIGHAKGLMLFDPRSGRARPWPPRTSGDIDGTVRRILETADGTLWLSLFGGNIRVYSAAGGLLHDIEPEDAGAHMLGVNALAQGPDGRPWLAGDRGLMRWDGRRFAAVAGSPRDRIFDFAFAEPSRIWISRFGALESYAWNGSALELLERTDNADGLPAVESSGLLFGRNGQVWVNTPRGLVLYAPDRRSLRVFGAHDGLPDPDFSLTAAQLGAGGTALALSAGGLALFDPDMRIPDSIPPPLVIETLSVRRDEDEWPLDPSRPIELGPEDRDLRITARLLSFADPRAHKYRFRLDGYDPDWVVQPANGERVFSRLDPGSYRLTVQAAGANGLWSEPRGFALSVRPPWWRTHWAMVAYIVLGALVLLALAAALQRRLRRRNAARLAEEERRLVLESSQAKTRFLATLGHEIRTPLTGVLGMSELLLRGGLGDRQRGQVEAIHGAGEHLLRLVNDALDLARIEAGKLALHDAPFDLRALIEETRALLAPLAQRKGLDFRREIDSDTPRGLRGDAHRVRQILLNLGHNAIKFTERGGVTLRVSGLAPSGVRLEMRDSGPGLNAEQQARLFQRFSQVDGPHTAARHGGSGLGLAICQELAAAMGGRIQVDSTPGVGTTFRVELPLPAAEVSPREAHPTRQAAARVVAPKRILLVEDDATIARVVTGLLETQGHSVGHVPHGLAALAQLQRERYDLAFVDLDLPGVDGFELARLIRGNGTTLPLIALTARADADAEPLSRAAGMDAFLRKPVTTRLLAEAIESVARTESQAVP